MANFIIAYGITSKNEAGYVNDPRDRGGETYKGIARNKNPNWQGWPKIDAMKAAGRSIAEIENDGELNSLKLSFFKTRYWDALRLDEVKSQGLANELYDASVVVGQGFAANSIQTVLNVANDGGKYYADLHVDGNIGPATISALNAHPRPEVLLFSFLVLQGEKYIGICLNNPSQECYYNGWIERLIQYKSAL